MADQFEELNPDPDDGIPVDYDPFPEDRLGEAIQALERLVRMAVSNTDKFTAAMNRQAKVLEALTSAINARREVVRDESGKITATKVVH